MRIAKELGFELRTKCDVSRAAYRMTGRCLEVLRENKDQWIADYSAKIPSIEKDINDMLNCGTIEWDAYVDGHLSYELMAFERVK